MAYECEKKVLEKLSLKKNISNYHSIMIRFGQFIHFFSFPVAEKLIKMAGSVKTVCFITSLVISWGLFEVGEAIVAWLDYKINGTEIPWKCELTNPIRICHMISILVHGLFLHGIRKENTNFIEPWVTFYCLFMIASFIPTGILVSIYGSNFLAFTEYSLSE